MYESFYELKEKPFSLLPDPDYLFLSHKHQMALTLLEYSMLNQAGFCVLSGDTGAGKTTLIRHLLNQFGDNITVGLITNTHRSFDDLLRWILMAYDLDYVGKNKVQLYQTFVNFLIKQYAKNRHTVLIVDEAQNMSVETLEELRMLSNVNADKDQVLQVILVGQPGLRKTLRLEELEQFAQRIAVDYDLQPLDKAETRDYIRHRLYVAGGKDGLFTDEACDAVYEYSGGTPRLINLLCDTALVYGYAEQKKIIDHKLINDVVRERQANGILPVFHSIADVAVDSGSDTEIDLSCLLGSDKADESQESTYGIADGESQDEKIQGGKTVTARIEDEDGIKEKSDYSPRLAVLNTPAQQSIAAVGRSLPKDTSVKSDSLWRRNTVMAIGLDSEKERPVTLNQSDIGKTESATSAERRQPQLCSQQGVSGNSVISKLFGIKNEDQHEAPANTEEAVNRIPSGDKKQAQESAAVGLYGAQDKHEHSNNSEATSEQLNKLKVIEELEQQTDDRLQDARLSDDISVDDSVDKDTDMSNQNMDQLHKDIISIDKRGVGMVMGFAAGVVLSVILLVTYFIFGYDSTSPRIISEQAYRIPMILPRAENSESIINTNNLTATGAILTERQKLDEARISALQRERDAALAEARALQRERDATLAEAKAQDEVRAAEMKAAQARRRERAAALEAQRIRKRELAAQEAIAALKRDQAAALAAESARLEALTSNEKIQAKTTPTGTANNARTQQPPVVDGQGQSDKDDSASKAAPLGFSANPCKGPSAIFLSTCRE